MFRLKLLSTACFMCATALAGPAAAQDALASTITEVSVYGSSALVHRAAPLPAMQPGEERTFVLQGLTRALDRENLRLSCQGGDVVSVEIKDRYAESPPDERLGMLREALKELQRERAGLQDESQVIEALGRHLDRLLKQEEAAHGREVGSGRPNPEAWAANYEFIATRLGENRRQARAKAWEIEDVDRRIRDLELDLGRIGQTSGIHVVDVEVVVVSHGSEQSSLGVDYIVGSAGWRPKYDLRAAKDARAVELVYRADIWQQTGEDWSDVAVLLSTARPKLGAQGPEPQPSWVDIVEPPSKYGGRVEARKQLRSLGYSGIPEEEYEDAAADSVRGLKVTARPFAAVENEGLSARFRLARRETIESRDQPTTVLVGRTSLGAEPEHVCVPALDKTVWLRGRATNDSEWTLLPGRAAVFFGADFLGHATLDAVQPGAEFTLHLGAVSGLVLERTQIEDRRKGPGFLGNKETSINGYRIHIENNGSPAAAEDGSVTVLVREVLPRPTDDRLDVDLAEAQPAPSEDERWRQDAEEKGIQTWALPVPAAGSADIVYQVRIAYPRGEQIRLR
ncbi:MAG: mucoidy inhibitor MuiA family protein [Planctomycetota bacterium]|nr:mucoidy inhibitor MuiA family protein [Planctomycetota bacterium]